MIESIPGLGDALNEDRAERLAGWVADRQLELCGIMVRPLTLRDTSYLEAVRNGFVLGGAILPAHILQFFDRIAIKLTGQKLAKKVGKLDYDKACQDITDFVVWHYFDAPQSSGPVSSPRAYNQLPIAYLVDLFASEYGWTRDQILDEPLTVLWQLFESIRMRVDNDYVGFSPNRYKVMQAFLDGLNNKEGD